MEDGGDGGIVESAHAGEVRRGHHKEGGVRQMRFGFEEDVGGLAWCDDNYVGGEWFYVDCIGFDDSERVVGDAEEELVVHGGVD